MLLADHFRKAVARRDVRRPVDIDQVILGRVISSRHFW